MHQSIATIDSPEFINLQPLEINPLMSSCEIKVLYIGENRNRSFITKEVATEMAKTLRGAPIVGYYKSEKEDFADHGNRMIFDDEGIKFECMTVPYGFVAPNAKVWFQKFNDYDAFGNAIQREYLMTTGYLWTGQFKECQAAVEGSGRPHSMELDEETLNGEWTKNYNTGMDFFIINDAIFSKLCILGEDVEPCFEGSSIKAPEVSKTFSLDNDFKQTLYTMMQDLKTVLEGGEHMPGEENFSIEQDNLEKEQFTENQDVIENENPTNVVEPVVEVSSDDTSFAKKEEEEKDNKEEDKAAPEEKDADDGSKEEPKKEEEDDEEKKKYTLLETQFAELQAQYSALQEQYNELVSFKNQIEDEKKDELIKSFYMLSDEDKAEVIANKAQYSLDDIEAKLSVICVRKKVNFSAEEEAPQVEVSVEAPAVTFNLESQASSVPAWVSALKNTQNSRNI
jgi:hypothetical protein